VGSRSISLRGAAISRDPFASPTSSSPWRRTPLRSSQGDVRSRCVGVLIHAIVFERNPWQLPFTREGAASPSLAVAFTAPPRSSAGLFVCALLGCSAQGRVYIWRDERERLHHLCLPPPHKSETTSRRKSPPWFHDGCFRDFSTAIKTEGFRRTLCAHARPSGDELVPTL
jgi:hypothetical protein